MIRRRHRATPGSCRARYAESQGPRGIARAAARWMRDIPPAKFEGTTGPRCATCAVVEADTKEAANWTALRHPFNCSSFGTRRPSITS
jgi:hypothetical protein